MEKNRNVLTLTSQSDRLFFGDSGHGIARYDVNRWPVFSKLNTKMQGFFWKPNEIDMANEKRSFDGMTDSEKFVFTSNLKRQILLDSIQGRSPGMVFLPHCTDSSLENCILTWGFFESIHSESYTHIIRAIYPDPSAVFDDLPNIKPIADCAVDITAAYDQMIASPSKENLYLALVSANALEAIRFYVSFACTFSFLERGLVEGSAKIIKFIARDEAVHLSLVQHILKTLPKDDAEFIEIIADNRDKATAIFQSAAEQEKQWAEYLFQHGSILGLNAEILCQYVDYLMGKRLAAINLIKSAPKATHPLPWIENHFHSDHVQVAPQEVEISSYITSGLINDLSDANFSL